jgi:hypothetical protein
MRIFSEKLIINNYLNFYKMHNKIDHKSETSPTNQDGKKNLFNI